MVKILQDVSGIVKPSRYVRKLGIIILVLNLCFTIHFTSESLNSFFRLTLLLGPPGSGKTTLLRALAAKLDDDLRVCSIPLCLLTMYRLESIVYWSAYKFNFLYTGDGTSDLLWP